MPTATEKRKHFRALLAAGPIIVAPGCADPITARLVEYAGLPAVHASGSVLHRAHGYADVGLLTLTEMVERIAAIADAVSLPVIGDGEEGFGSSVNVARTVKQFERAGAAAIHIEDSVFPKRSAHMGLEGGSIPRDEYLDKVRAALDARTDDALVIVARTGVEMDLQEKKERMHECIEAGADAFFVSSRNKDEIEELCRSLDKPGMGVVPARMTTPEYEACGVRCALLPGALPIAALEAQHAMLKELLESGSPNPYFAEKDGIEEMRRFYLNQGLADLQRNP